MSAQERFVVERQGDWARLESLVSRVQIGQLRALSASELEEMTRLYRLAASDLARARRDFPGDRVVSYLNRLVSSSYSHVYSGVGFSWKDIRGWYAGGFPRLFRATAGYYLLAALLFFGTGILSFVATITYPPAAQTLLPSNVYQSVASYAERGMLWTEIPAVERSLASATIMTNNIQVAMLAFAGGMLLGVGTAFILVYNGIHLGAIFGVVTTHGLGWDLLAFVSSHGVIELSVICLAGGAGMMLADSILRPGMLTRGESLRLAAQRAMQLLLGGASLLVIAGLIEGFLSPSEVPDAVKFGTGILTGVLLYGYWLLVGRGRKSEGTAQ
ncbi:MAG TPA: stage II sporulation protein M [Chloroflexia bacterium]|nr:stage II sporulation protein M [Chloroflexia bacterium]